VTQTYPIELVMAFLHANGDVRDDGQLAALNGIRLREGHRDMLKRWQRYDTVALGKIDSFLMQYDLMLWELDHFLDLAA
jgi:hypothetical protein